MPTLRIPELALIVLCGCSGAGKSSFARRHFKPTEILSSDFCRGLVADDENAQDATPDAFETLHFIARKRLARGLLTVVDATNVRPEDRKPLVALAREFHVLPVAIVLDLPERLCHERNRARPDRDFGPHVVRNQRLALRRGLRHLLREGFRHVYTLSTPEQVEAASITREPLWNNRKHDHGPFDIIGDIHGCYDELIELLTQLGYERIDLGGYTVLSPAPGGGDVGFATEGAPSPLSSPPLDEHYTPASAPNSASHEGRSSPRPDGERMPEGQVRGSSSSPPPFTLRHPHGRKAVFLGDLVDRGPDTPAVLRLAMAMVASGDALCIPGNHDMKLVRALSGKNVQITHGLAESLQQISAEPPEFKEQARAFLDDLVSHYVLDGGRLVVAHAGLKEQMQGRGSGRVREFCLYGETTGETDEFGLPVRLNWAAEYRGKATVVYGHTPVPEPQWLNNTINIDTGCVFGGRLTALRWPERELLSVPARAQHAEPRRPFLPPDEQAPALSAQQQLDDVLDLADVTGKRIVETRLMGKVTVREQNAAAALEVMSRFAIDPRWLIYLPPTMSPVETSGLPGLLEHPAEAFSHFRQAGVGRAICERKHMGSRAVVVLCRDEQAARRRFGVADGSAGACFTRTGRRFFEDAALEAALLQRVREAATRAHLWDELKTDWLCLDCELMPWSAKAQALLSEQYAAVGSAATAAMNEALRVLAHAAERTDDAKPLLERFAARAATIGRYTSAYREYCWPVASIDDLKLAPFHLLATEDAVHTGRDHLWHMNWSARLADAGDALLMATEHRAVDLSDPAGEAQATRWWEQLTAAGGEGMVVKPLAFIERGRRGPVQPAVKVRGPEYLRIIYGPEYTLPEHLERVRRRALGAKRSLALREFALGVEALERFIRREPLRRVHECVFAVLALESEPVDPRL